MKIEKMVLFAALLAAVLTVGCAKAPASVTVAESAPADQQIVDGVDGGTSVEGVPASEEPFATADTVMCPNPIGIRLPPESCIAQLAEFTVAAEKAKAAKKCPACPKSVESSAAEKEAERLRTKCQAALSEAAPALAPWQQEFQQGISASKTTETWFLINDKVYRECAAPLADFVEKNQTDPALKGDSDEAYKALTELRLRRARAMYALVMISAYPVGFPYSNSCRHTMVDELVQFLADARLEPSQVEASLTGAALAEQRKRSFRELYQICMSKSGEYTDKQVGDAYSGLCPEIEKGAVAEAETGLTVQEIEKLDCDGDAEEVPAP